MFYGCLSVFYKLLLIAKLFSVTGVTLGENRLYPGDFLCSWVPADTVHNSWESPHKFEP